MLPICLKDEEIYEHWASKKLSWMTTWRIFWQDNDWL